MSALETAGLLVAIGWGCVVATIILPFLNERVDFDILWLGFGGLFVAGVLAILVLNVNIDHLPSVQGIHGLEDVALYVLTFPMQVIGNRADGSWIVLGLVGGVVAALGINAAMKEPEPPVSGGD
jgi:hypothetical protein